MTEQPEATTTLPEMGGEDGIVARLERAVPRLSIVIDPAHARHHLHPLFAEHAGEEVSGQQVALVVVTALATYETILGNNVHFARVDARIVTTELVDDPAVRQAALDEMNERFEFLDWASDQ